LGHTLTLVLAAGLCIGCGATLPSSENAMMIKDFEDITDYDSPPVMIKAARPEYPEMLREIGAEGRVVLKVLVGENGQVDAVQILESPNVVLTDQAITALRESLFAPAIKDGAPCRATTIVPFVFDKGETWLRSKAGLEMEGPPAQPENVPLPLERPDSPDQDIKPSK
jgi:TonB family protein